MQPINSLVQALAQVGNNTYLHSLLKTLDLTMQALLISPQSVGKESQEQHQKNSGNDIYVGSVYDLQTTPCKKPGQGASVDGANNEWVVRSAYNTVKMSIKWCVSTATSDDMNVAE